MSMHRDTLTDEEHVLAREYILYVSAWKATKSSEYKEKVDQIKAKGLRVTKPEPGHPTVWTVWLNGRYGYVDMPYIEIEIELQKRFGIYKDNH